MPRLAPAFLLSAVAAIASHLAWPDAFWPYALLKPLTTVLVIAHAWRRGQPGDTRRRALLAGLVLSLLGDVALLWPQQGFLPGLVAFLLAHLAYLYAFTRGVRFGAWPLAFVGYALLAAGVLTLLWPGVPPGLRAPVVAYVLCLAAMAAQTASAWHAGRTGVVAALGGALFLTSDALLATNRFHTPLPLATLWVLATYWAAQWLIASALPPRRA
ncbi:MAG: hypothetical protein A3E25_11105 [Burkholderiales bacterium RIFCSPHIGHO2_12_FULL_69_20]|nr:MAG: hypothetical protein A3E25_11105 [Burkholderiales bacterium RIFCSPHIGHO2_12_FULL_69_20]